MLARLMPPSPERAILQLAAQQPDLTCVQHFVLGAPQQRPQLRGSLYTGIAKDVNRRCDQHNAGTASHYTRSRRPTRLAYQETHACRSLALQREAAIKALSRRAKESLIRLAG